MDSRTVCILGTRIIVKVMIRPKNLPKSSACRGEEVYHSVEMYQTDLKVDVYWGFVEPRVYFVIHV